jgi:signal transduction histidine kinase/ActR/RegA family two-component response regulator
LNNADQERLRAEHQLRAGFEELDRRVSERTAELVELNRDLEQKNQDLKQRDDQLRQSQKMEAVGTLAGGVAHEFNNLLQAIQAYTGFAMEGLSGDDPRYQDLQQALTASERAAGLTPQLLGFGRRQALELTNIDPNQLITDLVKLVRPLIGATIAVEVSLDENAGTIHADPGHFQQLMMNLCINARDAMRAGGKLLIKTEDVYLSQRYCDVHPDVQPGRHLAITVSDTGTGMPPEVMEHIFEPFFTTKGVGQGTGLGLSMVYGVVQQHHGVIRVYSEVGLGTTFKIYLPTVNGQADAEADGTVVAPQGGAETILIAEDEPLVRSLYERILGRAGYRLLTACDGQQAWELFQAHQEEVDLLMLDVVMPRKSGRELYRQIEAIEPRIPVIFCSGYDPETANVRFGDNCDEAFLQKPFDPDALLSKVRDVLDREALCPKT